MASVRQGFRACSAAGSWRGGVGTSLRCQESTTIHPILLPVEDHYVVHRLPVRVSALCGNCHCLTVLGKYRPNVLHHLAVFLQRNVLRRSIDAFQGNGVPGWTAGDWVILAVILRRIRRGGG